MSSALANATGYHNEYILESLRRVSNVYSKRRSFIIRVCYVLNIYLLFNSGAKSQRRNKKTSSEEDQKAITTPNTRKTGNLIDRIKNSNIIALLQHSKNNPKSMLLLVSQVGLVLFRAMLTLKIATLDGQLVSSLVSKRFRNFFKLLSIWLLIGFPVSLTESLIEKCQSLLALSIRSNVTDKLLSRYLPSNGTSTIYQLTNSKESTIGDSNHRLTTITDLFSQACSILPAQLLTPVLDILLSGNALHKSSESASEGAILLGLIANVSTLALRVFTPNFSRLSTTRNALENKFHTFHSNIIHNVEEIALAKGHRREIDLLDTSYLEYEKFSRMELRRLAVYNFAVSFIFKYSLGAFGLLLCSTPIFMSAYMNDFKIDDKLVSNLSSDFVTNRRLLMSASDSLGQLIQSKKNIQNMLGYAKNLREFEVILEDINKSLELEQSINTSSQSSDLLLKGPNVRYGDEITFDKVPLVTPAGNVLVKDLSFSIKQGQNLLIIGPNGCGKSSLFRILGGLWDIKDPGTVCIPHSKNDLFYLPQRSYLTYGSLREQIIYPDSFEDYLAKVNSGARNRNGKLINDDLLLEFLTMVKLDHLVESAYDSDEERVDEECDGDSECKALVQMLPHLNKKDKWGDVLSVGEQQRLAMVRLYYHCPKFAVLDECTSWISSDLEDRCYELATKDMAITVLSVCHRTSLWKFHNHILKFKRDEGEEVSHTTFTKFDPVVRLERHEEMIEIDHSIKRAEDIQRRLNLLQRRMARSGSRGSTFLMDDEEDDEETE